MGKALEGRIAWAFRMSDKIWARHANPWSVWTRFTALPLLVAAVWSRAWIGWWSLVPVVASVVWIWLNPHVFPRPPSTDNWASRAVLGERVWLNRKAVPVPARHRLMPNILSLVSGLGLPFLIYGLIRLDPWPTLLGVVLVYAGKLWFLDRMVWLYEDMEDATAEYRQWVY